MASSSPPHLATDLPSIDPDRAVPRFDRRLLRLSGALALTISLCAAPMARRADCADPESPVVALDADPQGAVRLATAAGHSTHRLAFHVHPLGNHKLCERAKSNGVHTATTFSVSALSIANSAPSLASVSLGDDSHPCTAESTRLPLVVSAADGYVEVVLCTWDLASGATYTGRLDVVAGGTTGSRTHSWPLTVQTLDEPAIRIVQADELNVVAYSPATLLCPLAQSRSDDRDHASTTDGWTWGRLFSRWCADQSSLSDRPDGFVTLALDRDTASVSDVQPLPERLTGIGAGKASTSMQQSNLAFTFPHAMGKPNEWIPLQSFAGGAHVDGRGIEPGGFIDIGVRVNDLAAGEYRPQLRFLATGASRDSAKSITTMVIRVGHHWALPVAVLLIGGILGWLVGRRIPFVMRRVKLEGAAAEVERKLSSLYGTKRWLPGVPTGTGRYKAIFTAWADIAQIRRNCSQPSLSEDLAKQCEMLIKVAEDRRNAVEQIDGARVAIYSNVGNYFSGRSAAAVDVARLYDQASSSNLDLAKLTAVIGQTTVNYGHVAPKWTTVEARAEQVLSRLSHLTSLRAAIEALMSSGAENQTAAYLARLIFHGSGRSDANAIALDECVEWLDLLTIAASSMKDWKGSTSQRWPEIRATLKNVRFTGMPPIQLRQALEAADKRIHAETLEKLLRLSSLEALRDWTYRIQWQQIASNVDRARNSLPTAYHGSIVPLSLMTLSFLPDDVSRTLEFHPCEIRWSIVRRRFGLPFVFGKREHAGSTAGSTLVWFFKRAGAFRISGEARFGGGPVKSCSFGTRTISVAKSPEDVAARRASRWAAVAGTTIAGYSILVGFLAAYGPSFGSATDYLAMFALAAAATGGGTAFVRANA